MTPLKLFFHNILAGLGQPAGGSMAVSRPVLYGKVVIVCGFRTLFSHVASATSGVKEKKRDSYSSKPQRREQKTHMHNIWDKMRVQDNHFDL